MEERQAYATVTGQVILQLRAMRGLSQETLASHATLSQSALSRFENGQTLPDAYELRVLASALGLTPVKFTERIEEAFARTRDVVKKVAPGSGVIAAGVLAGLAIAVVAGMLDEANKKNARKKS